MEVGGALGARTSRLPSPPLCWAWVGFRPLSQVLPLAIGMAEAMLACPLLTHRDSFPTIERILDTPLPHPRSPSPGQE